MERILLIGKRRKKGFFPILLVITTLFLGAVTFRTFLYWNTPAEDPGREVVVEISGGSTLVSASEKLLDAGVIKSLRPFVLLGKVKGMSSSIQAGELLFRTDMTPVEVLEVLVHGKAFTYTVTFPEGSSVRQIIGLLVEKGLGDKDRFMSISEDASFARSLEIPADRFEGFLFPDTYAWPKGLSEKDIFKRMVSRYGEYFTEEHRLRASEIGMTELAVITLASIIERETGAPEERSLVSAVFHNRLKKGYRLQTDPTVIYGLKDFDGDLKVKHLRTDHPYNTYTREGLPPGPIASPGEDSINAALYPADVSYLYFVARGDGTHVFSNNLVDHNKAVKAFQLGGGG